MGMFDYLMIAKNHLPEKYKSIVDWQTKSTPCYMDLYFISENGYLFNLGYFEEVDGNKFSLQKYYEDPKQELPKWVINFNDNITFYGSLNGIRVEFCASFVLGIMQELKLMKPIESEYIY